MRIGFSVDDAVSRLKRHHWTFRRLHGIFTNRLTSEPVYELKMAFSLHAHYCAEHAAAWRERVGEMREPPLGLDTVPDASLEVFLDEILAAPDTAALVVGIYGHALPALQAALRMWLKPTGLWTIRRSGSAGSRSSRWGRWSSTERPRLRGS